PLLPPAAPVRRLELLRARARPARRRDRRRLPRRSRSEAARLHPVPDNRVGTGAGARTRRPPRPRGLSPLPSVLPPACLAGRQSSLIGVSRPPGTARTASHAASQAPPMSPPRVTAADRE